MEKCVSLDAPFGVAPPQWLVVSDSAFLSVAHADY